MDTENALELIAETAELIADYYGMNVPYGESMDMSLFPIAVGLLNDETEEDCLNDLHFMAENNTLIPDSLAGASFEKIKKYVNEHKDEILSGIETACKEYQKEVAC